MKIAADMEHSIWRMMKMAKWLIACEYSGKMRKAMQAKGHDVTSIDLLPSDDNSPDHKIGDALFEARYGGYDGMIAHPPCTFLNNAGVTWLTGPANIDKNFQFWSPSKQDFVKANRERYENMMKGAKFFADLLKAPIDKIAVENPIMHMYAKDAISHYLEKPMPKMKFVQPWWFGHEAFKATGFALKNLDPLSKPADALTPPKVGTQEHKDWTNRIHGLPPSPDRWKIRSTTFSGIATAAAEAWG